jgi:S1-C subfamily serine protease
VRKRGSDKKYQAKAVAVGEECDLAILTVEDDDFWDYADPIELGALAELTDDVTVIGYPVGGECISITAGVVSRVEMTVYAQVRAHLCLLQCCCNACYCL